MSVYLYVYGRFPSTQHTIPHHITRFKKKQFRLPSEDGDDDSMMEEEEGEEGGGGGGGGVRKYRVMLQQASFAAYIYICMYIYV